MGPSRTIIRMLKQLSVSVELSDSSLGGSGLDLISSVYPQPPLLVLSLGHGCSLIKADQWKASTDYVSLGCFRKTHL